MKLKGNCGGIWDKTCNNFYYCGRKKWITSDYSQLCVRFSWICTFIDGVSLYPLVHQFKSFILNDKSKYADIYES